MTLIELMVVLVVITVLAALILPITMQRQNNLRIQCVSNLKQVGLAFRIWEGDNGGRYPMAVSGTNGGSMEFTTGPNVFRHFQVMSNELSTPKVLLCPSELWEGPHGCCATNFEFLRNSNISFFVGVDARETNATMILSGDRNITNDLSARNAMLELTTNQPARWTSEMHNKVGNILLADGSVQMDDAFALQKQIADTGVSTNRLQMP